MALGGRYAELFNVQASGYLDAHGANGSGSDGPAEAASESRA
jgi:hypothetical protein